jgi:flagellar basal body-associated protein FliL
MEKRPKINLKQYQSSKVSKKFILKMLLYFIVLLALGIFVHYKLGEQEEAKNAPVEIHHVTIDTVSVMD